MSESLIDTILDAVQYFLSNENGTHTDINAQDILDNINFDGLDLSLYTPDEIKEAIDAVLLNHIGSSGCGGECIPGDISNADKVPFESVPNDPSFHYTRETVNIRCTLGLDEGNYHIYTHDGHKYVYFKDTWVEVIKNRTFMLKGNKYYFK